MAKTSRVPVCGIHIMRTMTFGQATQQHIPVRGVLRFLLRNSGALMILPYSDMALSFLIYYSLGRGYTSVRYGIHYQLFQLDWGSIYG